MQRFVLAAIILAAAATAAALACISNTVRCEPGSVGTLYLASEIYVKPNQTPMLRPVGVVFGRPGRYRISWTMQPWGKTVVPSLDQRTLAHAYAVERKRHDSLVLMPCD